MYTEHRVRKYAALGLQSSGRLKANLPIYALKRQQKNRDRLQIFGVLFDPNALISI